jgi:hypothetical protein
MIAAERNGIMMLEQIAALRALNHGKQKRSSAEPNARQDLQDRSVISYLSDLAAAGTSASEPSRAHIISRAYQVPRADITRCAYPDLHHG